MLTERHINAFMFTFASAILFVMIVATVLAEDIIGLDGTVGVIDHQVIWDSIDAFVGSVYLIGDLGCHQETARSFMIGSSQMPFCIRETMVFVGVIIGCTLLQFRPSFCSDYKRMIPLSFLLGCATLFEWLAQNYCGLDDLFLVGLSGMMTGVGGAFLLYSIIEAEVEFLNKG